MIGYQRGEEEKGVSLVTKHQSHIGGFSHHLHGERLINKGPCFASHLIPIVVLLSYLSNSSFLKNFPI